MWRRLADGCAFSGGADGLALTATRAPGASSITRARTRLWTEPLTLLFAETARPLARPDTPGAWWRGLRLTAVDGTCLDVANTPANREAFGGPTDAAFPQIRLVARCEIGTRAVVDSGFCISLMSIELISSCVDECGDGAGNVGGAVGIAAEFTQDAPGFQLREGAFAGCA